jgi:hypothetical protein
MASLEDIVGRALSSMAQGSQTDAKTVLAAVSPIIAYDTQPTNSRDTRGYSELPPHVRDLLHAAGWLYPCFMPSSTLPHNLQEAAFQAWMCCTSEACMALKMYEPPHVNILLSLGEPRYQPRVPGEFTPTPSPAHRCCAACGPLTRT